ncbi:MAG: hypothetical protein Q9N62_12135 [Ghiorsea sp.]|nr:hypothetical protein [Ghiorsea sp.]
MRLLDNRLWCIHREPKDINRSTGEAKAAMMVAANSSFHYPHTSTTHITIIKQAEGKKHSQAVRSLARHLSRHLVVGEK